MTTIAANTYSQTTAATYDLLSSEQTSTVSQASTAQTEQASSNSNTANSAALSSQDTVTLSSSGASLAADRATINDILTFTQDALDAEAELYYEELIAYGMRENAEFEILDDGEGGYTITANYLDEPFLESFFIEHPDKVAAFIAIDTVTVEDTLNYQKAQQTTFDEALRSGLLDEGLDTSTTYNVQADGKGGYTIEADAETAALIDTFLQNNPDIAKLLTKASTALDVELSSQATSSTTTSESTSTAVEGTLDSEEVKSAHKQLEQLTTFLLMQSASSAMSAAQLQSYQEDIRTQFEAQMKSDLKQLGVDEDIIFTLQADTQGNVVVITDSDDKAVIEQYLDDNPDMANAFVKLEKVTADLETRASSYNAMAERQRIQLEAMSTWFMSTGSSTTTGSAAADMFAGSSFDSSLNTTV